MNELMIFHTVKSWESGMEHRTEIVHVKSSRKYYCKQIQVYTKVCIQISLLHETFQ